MGIKFKVGDRVIYKNMYNTYAAMTPGKSYEVVDKNEYIMHGIETIGIINDNGGRYFFNANLFRLDISGIRKEKLKNINLK